MKQQILIFELSKEDLKIAKNEIIRLLKPKDKSIIENFLIAEVDTNKKELIKRLAYTNNVYELVLQCREKYLEKSIEKCKLKEYYETNFCAKKIGENELDEKQLGSLIWKRLEKEGIKPKVKLEKAKTIFTFIFFKFKTHTRVKLGKLMWHNEKDFLKRKAHKRPVLFPASLNPKIARAMVNLTGIEKGLVVDPFCGTGGLLIEAGLMGLKIKGYDINKWMINACEKNFKHYKIKDYNLIVKDACKVKGKFDAIVADLPYSKNTRDVEIEKLYKEFFKNSYGLTKTMVIGLPHYVNYKKLISKWKVKNRFKQYLHKSLSKVILVLEKE